MTGNEIKYLAFLSYSPQDNCEHRPGTPEVNHRCWGDWLHEALKTFSIPPEFVGQVNGRGEIIPERIQPIFRNEQELTGDAVLSAEIRQALEQSTCLIVICSPRSAQDLQVNEAVRYFKQLGRSKNILPIVVAGEPNAGDGNKPCVSPEAECFVPALRHPVQPDGTLDLTRRAGRYLFVDARHSAEKREILANDNRTAEADLEMAKIHLIALLIGVGFNGLWWREQKRHFHDFSEAQQQVREALNQVEEAQRQLQAAQLKTREAQNQVLEIQNLPRDVHGQIQEAQNQAVAAQNQARAAQQQLQEFQNKVRDTQTQLEEARERARAAESKVLEAQTLTRQVQNQLEETRNQAREAQNQVLEMQNLSQAGPNQIQEAQNQLQIAQSQLEEIRNQAQAVHNQFLESQSQAQEFQNQVRSAQTQLEEAHNRALAAESKVLEAQNQVREVQGQLDEARNHEREAQNTQSQLEETRNQAQDFHNKFLEAQSHLEAARHQVREAQSKIVEVQTQARDAQKQVQEIQSQSQNAERDAQSRIKAAQNQIQETQNRSRNARRLTKALALLAVLALLAAGVAAREALRQRQIASQALAKATAETAGNFDLTTGALDQEKIRQVLGNIGGAEQDGNRRRSLDQLAASISRAEIPEALQASSVILNDQQRSHFQKWLLIRQGWVNPAAAMTNASAIEAKIVNDEGMSDSGSYFQLAVLDNWMKTDLPAAFNWVCQLPDADSRSRALEKIIPALAADNPQDALARLNDLQPAPDEQTYQLLFQCWAERDPQAAEQFARQHLGLSGDALGEMAEAWLQNGWLGVLQEINLLDSPPEIMQPQKAPSPWAKFFLNANFGRPIFFPVETKILSNATNDPVQIKPKE